MRFLKATLVLCSLSFSFSALADPPEKLHKRIRKLPPGVVQSQQPQQPQQPPPPPPPDQSAMCSQKKSILAQDQDRLDDLKTQLTGLDAEAAQLQRRLAEIQRQRGPLQKYVSNFESRVKRNSDAYKAECSQAETCAQYEALATQLDQQGNGIQTQVASVRTQMDTYRTNVRTLDSQIEPLRNEYATLQCSNLVPGSTAQQTIDRCSAIFSQWNRMQAQLNSLNANIPILKRQHQEFISQLRAIEARAASYDLYMSQNCRTSPQYQMVQTYRGGDVRKNAESMTIELDNLISEVARLKGVQISVVAK